MIKQVVYYAILDMVHDACNDECEFRLHEMVCVIREVTTEVCGAEEQ